MLDVATKSLVQIISTCPGAGPLGTITVQLHSPYRSTRRTRAERAVAEMTDPDKLVFVKRIVMLLTAINEGRMDDVYSAELRELFGDKIDEVLYQELLFTLSSLEDGRYQLSCLAGFTENDTNGYHLAETKTVFVITADYQEISEIIEIVTSHKRRKPLCVGLKNFKLLIWPRDWS